MQKLPTQYSMKRSTDGGATWLNVPSFFGEIGTFVTSIAPHPTDGQLAFAGGETPIVGQSSSSLPSSEIVEPAAIYTNGVFYTIDAGVNWYNSGTLGKNISSLTTYTSGTTTYVFAATKDANNKLYKCTNASITNATWSLVSTYNGGLINDIRVDQNNVIYVAADDGIYRSTDNGATWITFGCFVDPNYMKKICIDPQNVNNITVGSTSNIYKSTDGGITWRDAAPNSIILPINTVGSWSQTNLAAPSNYSFIEKGSGTSWYPVTLGSCVNNFRGRMVGFRPGNYAFAVGYRDLGIGNTTASLWRSTNNGDYPWVEVRSGTYTSGKYNGFIHDPANSSRIYAYGLKHSGLLSTNENICASNDNGAIWERTTPIPNSLSSTVYEVSDLVVDSSSRGGSSISLKLFASVFNGTTGEVGIWKSTNSGTSWINPPILSQPIRSLGFNPKIPLTIYGAGGSTALGWKLWKSVNNGYSWSEVPTGITKEISRVIMHPTYKNSANFVWILTADGQQIYNTTNGGTNWTEVNTTVLPKPITDIRGNAGVDSLITVSTFTGVYTINPAPNVPRGFGVSDYCTGGALVVMRPAPVDCVPFLRWQANQETDGSVYKIYRETNGDGNWIDLVTLPYTATQFIDWAIEANTYYAYKIEARDLTNHTSGLTNAVGWPLGKFSESGRNQQQFVPKEYKLFQNIPNPFNPVTKIRYSLPENTIVTLKIYDITGQEVVSLVNEFQAAGEKSVEFNADIFPSGIYFYRLSTSKYSSVMKMLLVK
jgi:photosystem II stability/assembly factor-like uncharacterized protein